MKIIKFLYASNFQLHLPVICWGTPLSSSGMISEADRFLSEREKLKEGTENSNLETKALLKGLSGNSSTRRGWKKSDAMKASAERGLLQDLPLERLDFAFGGGLFPNVSTEIQEACLSAGWNSARKVFDLAIEQNVDFVLLTGDVLQPDLTGIRGIAFLNEQFQRLKDRGISVYWKLERSLERWKLPDFHFPENVFLFPASVSHIKKFRLPDFSKDIFIVSQDSSTPMFSRYDLSQLPNEKIPFFQTIAFCPDEEALERGFIRHGDSARRLDSAFEPLNRVGQNQTGQNWGGENRVEQNGEAEIFPDKTEFSVPVSDREGLEKLNVWDSIAELTNVSEQNSEGRSFLFRSSVSESDEIPFCEAAFVALTAVEKRLTRKRTWKTPEGEERLSIVHSPGPIQYRSPDIYDLNSNDPRPAGVTIVQQDLDGDVPVSLQFFPTESVCWRFLEKRVPGDILSWEDLSRWMKDVLVQEFSEKDVAEYPFRRNSDERSDSVLSSSRSGQSDSALVSKRGGRKSQEKNPAPESGREEIAENSKLVESDSERADFERDERREPSPLVAFAGISRRILVFWKLSSDKPAQGELLRSLLKEGIEPEINDSNQMETNQRGLDPGEQNPEGLNHTQTLLEELREVGAQLPFCPWSVSISVERHGLIPHSWGQTDSMLGDFLRLAQFHLINPEHEDRSPDFATHSLNLDDMLEEDQLGTSLQAMTKLTLNEEAILLELASVLGADALAKAQEGRRK